ncbi:MAG: NADH-quinone oxidoreductase subunit NuoE [Nitrospinota bacterium]
MAETAQEHLSQVEEIVRRHPPGRESLIPVLQDIQERFGYLSEESVDELARVTGISENEIYGVATFFTQFRVTPPGEHRIQACLGTACHVRGGHQILSELEQRLGIKAGETTADRKFDLERVACIGCCALAPVVVVDGDVHARMAPQKVRSIISRYRRDKAGGDA